MLLVILILLLGTFFVFCKDLVYYSMNHLFFSLLSLLGILCFSPLNHSNSSYLSYSLLIFRYNVQNFDLPYVLDRAAALVKKNKQLKSKFEIFKQWGRINGSMAKMRDTTVRSSIYSRSYTSHGSLIVILPCMYNTANNILPSWYSMDMCTRIVPIRSLR